MDQEKLIKLTIAAQIVAKVIDHVDMSGENSTDEIVSLTKNIVDKLYERI